MDMFLKCIILFNSMDFFTVLVPFLIIMFSLIVVVLIVVPMIGPVWFPIGLHLPGLCLQHFTFPIIMVCDMIQLSELTLVLWMAYFSYSYCPMQRPWWAKLVPPHRMATWVHVRTHLLGTVFIGLIIGIKSLHEFESFTELNKFLLMVWTIGSKPCRTMVICHEFGTPNLAISRISSSGRAQSAMNSRNLLKYWFISTSCVMKSQMDTLWVLCSMCCMNQHCICKVHWGSTCVIRSCMVAQ